MSLFRSNSETPEQATADRYETLRVGSQLVEFATQAEEQEAIGVRPHEDNGGIGAMHDVLTALHSVETESSGLVRRRTENVSPAHAFEIRYAAVDRNERVLSLQYVDGTSGRDSVLKRQLQNEYSNSLIETQPARFLPLREGRYIAGATLALRRYTLYPIQALELDGWRSDPTGSIMQEMVGLGDGDGSEGANVAIQVLFKPAQRSWLSGVENGEGVGDVDDTLEGSPSVKDLAYELRQPSYEIHRPVPWERERIEHAPSKKDKDVAKMLEGQDGKAWRVYIRVFAAARDESVAQRRAANVASMFKNYYEFRGEQTFIPQPLATQDLREEFDRATRREWTDCGIVKTQHEVAGLTNIPEADDVTTSKMRWSLTKPGDGVPPSTPRFPFAEQGLEDASQNERQRAIFDASAPGEPFYFGWGSKHDVEAGIYQRYLDAHMFAAGRTRYGKTTFLEHFCSQVFERGEGALVVDPKGKDADDFIREWPDDRSEEDLVVMDLGLNPEGEGYENVPRFNFMEIPPGYDPDSRFAATMIEALADDLTAMVAQSGGSDNYLGALMKRVTKAVARGLLKSGRGVTLLDLACACSSQAGLSEFARWMDEDRIAFIRDTAHRFEEKEDSDLEPLAGRMDEWIHNDAIRDLISARDPSFSIHEVVSDGKVVVVRFAEGAGESERRLLTTALIRRTYASKRVCDNADPFYLVCDEFDKIVTEESNLHTILSEAGGHNYRCVLACQAPDSQLPGRVKDAVGNQIDTFVTFNPGAQNTDYVAKHHTVDAETLRHMPRYKCYLKTHTDDDDITHSYLVDAFPPIREVRAELTGDPGRSDDELEAMKRRSMERYGDRIESPEEQQKQSAFYEGGAVTPIEGGPTSLDMTDKEVRNLALKAVFDESIRQGNPGGFVAVEECVGRLQRYLPEGEKITDAGKAWRNVLQEIPDAYLDHREIDDQMEVRAADKGFMNVGMSENDGKAEHWAPMANAYVPFTQLGFVMAIPDQTGDAMPDGMAKLDDALHVEGIEDPARIADRVNSYRENNKLLHRLAGTQDSYIESEHSTGSTQPSQTVRNLVQAHNQGHRCLFFAREKTAEQVYDTVANEPICCRSNHREENERRFYTSTTTLTIDGQTITRPGGSENVWVQDVKTGQYVLRDTDGTVHATFDTPTEIYTDASAYPSGGDRNVKPPVIPEYEISGEDLEAIEWDIVVVPEPERDNEGNERMLTPLDLKLYREGNSNIPLAELLNADLHYEQTSEKNLCMTQDSQKRQKPAEMPKTDDTGSSTPDNDDGSGDLVDQYNTLF